MKILAIDPGTVESGYVEWDVEANILLGFGNVENCRLLELIRPSYTGRNCHNHLVVEMIASNGMPVGAEIFETCVWIGRFVERFNRVEATRLITRNEIKNHICHSSRAKDSNIRQAIIDRFGGKEKAIGRKASPGPLYGLAGDAWAALAVALTWMDWAPSSQLLTKEA